MESESSERLGIGNPTSLPPLIAQREFVPQNVETVVALVTAIDQATFAFGPAFFGCLHDLTHDYAAGFVAAGVVQALAAVVVSRRQRFP